MKRNTHYFEGHFGFDPEMRHRLSSFSMPLKEWEKKAQEAADQINSRAASIRGSLTLRPARIDHVDGGKRMPMKDIEATVLRRGRRISVRVDVYRPHGDLLLSLEEAESYANALARGCLDSPTPKNTSPNYLLAEDEFSVLARRRALEFGDQRTAELAAEMEAGMTLLAGAGLLDPIEVHKGGEESFCDAESGICYPNAAAYYAAKERERIVNFLKEAAAEAEKAKVPSIVPKFADMLAEAVLEGTEESCMETLRSMTKRATG